MVVLYGFGIQNMASSSLNQQTVISKEEEIVTLVSSEDNKISILKLDFFDSLHLKLNGSVKVGTIGKHNGEKMDIFLFECKKHGMQLASPSGWSNRLLCSACLNEVKEAFLGDINNKSISKSIEKSKEYSEPLKKFLNKNNLNHK